MMEAARTSETLVNFYQATRSYNPEDSHLGFIYDLFNDAVSSSDYLAPNDNMIYMQ
jgi:hypothetical protein